MKEINKVDNASIAFGISLAITVIFNTLLACVKDAYEPLNKFMASLFGHHWTTHGIIDILVFLLVGLLIMRSSIAQKVNPALIAKLIYISTIASALGLIVWFLLY